MPLYPRRAPHPLGERLSPRASRRVVTPRPLVLLLAALLTALLATGCGGEQEGGAPAGGVTPPAGGVTPPAGDVTPPAGRAPCEETGSCPPGIIWVRVPGGSFQMGSTVNSDEQPIRTVTLSDFEMSKMEVTVRDYRACVEAGACDEPNVCDFGTPNWSTTPADREDLPINCVDWGQARSFAKWVGADLPTEAEWEYAARGGQPFEYAGSDNPDDVAWYDENSGE